MLSWLWDRKNFGLQNMVNSVLKGINDNMYSDSNLNVQKTTLKNTNKSFEVQINYIMKDQDWFTYQDTVSLKNLKNTNLKWGSYHHRSAKQYKLINEVDDCLTSWKEYFGSTHVLHAWDVSHGDVSLQFNYTSVYPLPSEYPNIIWPTS